MGKKKTDTAALDKLLEWVNPEKVVTQQLADETKVAFNHLMELREGEHDFKIGGPYAR